MTDDDLTPPAKRNVKALTAFLGEMEAGDAVVATFTTDRYGVFAVRGEVVQSQLLGAFTLGSHPLDSNRKPSKALQLLRTFHSAEREEAAASRPSDPAAVDESVAHGALIRVTYSEPAYGVFDVAGVAVHSSVDDSILVGSWMVSTHDRIAERVLAVEVLAPVGGHELAVPREITSWGNESAADV
ncbi:hypothetical protein [Frondihabitans australicus]|uniref:Uncharacterized protein n=1 Tax=Frondihabitans australicus TaxID=386892 RepID=A0A495IGY7_9MICO|nr:hypothetical protein [Frondihabitans australicus]RKR74336.1 hypothetical protein C8E83_1447 [Frondihabitans australicus]